MKRENGNGNGQEKTLQGCETEKWKFSFFYHNTRLKAAEELYAACQVEFPDDELRFAVFSLRDSDKSHLFPQNNETKTQRKAGVEQPFRAVRRCEELFFSEKHADIFR